MLEHLPPQRNQRGDAAKAVEQSQGKAEAGGVRGGRGSHAQYRAEVGWQRTPRAELASLALEKLSRGNPLEPRKHLTWFALTLNTPTESAKPGTGGVGRCRYDDDGRVLGPDVAATVAAGL